MELTIIRKQELTNVRGNNRLKLDLEINIALSKKERELIDKYYDPPLMGSELRDFAGLAKVSSIKLKEPTSLLTAPPTLSKCKVVASTEDGFSDLGNMQRLVDATITLTKNKLDYLVALEGWDGEEVVDTSQELV